MKRSHRSLLATALGTAGGPVAAADPTDPVTVTVNTRAGLATVPATALGVNDAIWERLEESGADPPWLSDALRRIERDLRTRQARKTSRQ